jgi:hypothetical protein
MPLALCWCTTRPRVITLAAPWLILVRSDSRIPPFLVLLVLVPLLAHADEGYKELFKSTTIPKADQVSIYRQLGLKLAPDGRQFFAEGCDDPASYEVETPDLNNDGVPEVVVSGGGACFTGSAGGLIYLFVKAPRDIV